jgi:hypothetical protein
VQLRNWIGHQLEWDSGSRRGLRRLLGAATLLSCAELKVRLQLSAPRDNVYHGSAPLSSFFNRQLVRLLGKATLYRMAFRVVADNNSGQYSSVP